MASAASNTAEVKARQLLGGPRFPDAGPLHLLLLLIMLAYVGDDGRICVKDRRLVDETSLSLRQVSRLKAELKDWGVIREVAVKGTTPVFELGEAFALDPISDHSIAMDAKARTQAAKPKKAKTDSEVSLARALDRANKRWPDDLRVKERDEDLLRYPHETAKEVREVLDGDRKVLTKWPKRFVSFASKDTRPAEDEETYSDAA